MQKITDLSNYRNKKLLMIETKKLSEYILDQAKNSEAIHTVEQGIWDKLLAMGKQALGQFIALQGDGDMKDSDAPKWKFEINTSTGHVIYELN